MHLLPHHFEALVNKSFGSIATKVLYMTIVRPQDFSDDTSRRIIHTIVEAPAFRSYIHHIHIGCIDLQPRNALFGREILERERDVYNGIKKCGLRALDKLHIDTQMKADWRLNIQKDVSCAPISLVPFLLPNIQSFVLGSTITGTKRTIAAWFAKDSHPISKQWLGSQWKLAPSVLPLLISGLLTLERLSSVVLNMTGVHTKWLWTIMSNVPSLKSLYLKRLASNDEKTSESYCRQIAGLNTEITTLRIADKACNIVTSKYIKLVESIVQGCQRLSVFQYHHNSIYPTTNTSQDACIPFWDIVRILRPVCHNITTLEYLKYSEVDSMALGKMHSQVPVTRTMAEFTKCRP